MICIDLGSNTLRACEMDENLEVISSFEKIVGSARNISQKGLADDAMERICCALIELRSKFDFSSGYFAAATQAFRISPNAKQFFERVYDEFGIKFEIIDGVSEAKFTKFGILNRTNRLGFDANLALSIDLGGASTEISFGEHFESFEFGIVRFCEKCDKNIAKFSQNADFATVKAREFMRKFKFDSVILTSGVPTTVAALVLGMDYASYDARFINGYKLKFDDFDKAYDMIISSNEPENLVGANRAYILLAGICLLKSLLSGVNVPFVVIDDGLREGLGVACDKKILAKKEFRGIK